MGAGPWQQAASCHGLKHEKVFEGTECASRCIEHDQTCCPQEETIVTASSSDAAEARADVRASAERLAELAWNLDEQQHNTFSQTEEHLVDGEGTSQPSHPWESNDDSVCRPIVIRTISRLDGEWKRGADGILLGVVQNKQICWSIDRYDMVPSSLMMLGDNRVSVQLMGREHGGTFLEEQGTEMIEWDDGEIWVKVPSDATLHL
eukprot:TRINITY_DN20777_c0_g1_i1.p1 TRINITY_DN20777_c0_g1~~TRINITY_DN20777_c0_g1_i1.p1  ORF type:complete len:217 (-),score=24.92 TRINITY_DN20777_c0_g1_i1:34-648(-)